MSTFLLLKNVHERDQYISFEESTHTYTVHGESNYTSVTTWNHSHFEKFEEEKIIASILRNPKHKKDVNYKYYGKTAEEIHAEWEANRICASTAGTKMHLDIEYYYNGDFDKILGGDSIEFSFFHNFVADFERDFPYMRPYRTEWTVFFEELRIAGSIDMIFENVNDGGSLWVYDWKRCKEITYESSFGNKTAKTPCLSDLPDTNFWHYSLQLNMYKMILETKYGKRVTKMCLVCLHPDNYNHNYQLHEVNPMSPERIEELCSYRKEELLLK